ncbi:MAG: hypothetical protein K9L88_08035 [Chromatiaceae bacterium]|nr:hypothetical protein [Chromatiaceae bacterium]
MILAFTRYTNDLPDHTNARNWPGYILMRRGLDYRAAIWAQEAYEATYKLNPWVLLRYSFSRSLRQAMEIMGHAIETAAAERLYHADANRYRRDEARALRWYDDFSSESEPDIERQLLAAHNEAAQWVERHLKQIKQHLSEG